MAEAPKHDYKVTINEYFETQVTAYSDSRIKRWRGVYDEHFLYKIGDATYNTEGEAWVCIQETEHVEPGGFADNFAWSPAKPLRLVGYTIKWHCGTVFTQIITLSTEHAEKGYIGVEIPPTEFANPPSQEHYYLEVISPTGKKTDLLNGAMFFRTP